MTIAEVHRQRLTDFLESETDEALAWIMAPNLSWLMRSSQPEPRVAPRLRSTVLNSGQYRALLPTVERSASAIRALAPSRQGVDVRRHGEALFVTLSANQQRVVDPIVQAFAGRDRSVLPIQKAQADLQALRRFGRDGVRIAGNFLEFSDKAGLHVDPVRAHRSFQNSARLLAFAQRLLLAKPQPKAVIVANQGIPQTRAFCRAARLVGVPVVYFPHAPVAANEFYSDLPVDYAGLRGKGEVDFYKELGICEAELDIVGNPAMGDVAMPVIDPTAPPVVAVSAPLPRAATAALLDMVRAAVPGPVTIAPHPASNMKELESLMYPGWTTSIPGQSMQALLDGPPCVIQQTSGIAWEALHLGIPTLQIATRAAQYGMIAEPAVTFASTAAEIESFVRSARATADDQPTRLRLREWADYWCAATGAEAARRGADLIDLAVRSGARDAPIFDAYGQATSWWDTP